MRTSELCFGLIFDQLHIDKCGQLASQLQIHAVNYICQHLFALIWSRTVSNRKLFEAMSADISSMNVAALKALCKSRGIRGYSKLSRQALLGKLGVSNADFSSNGRSQSSREM